MIISYKSVPWNTSKSKVQNNIILHNEVYKLLEKILYNKGLNRYSSFDYKYSKFGKPSFSNEVYKFNVSYCKGMVCLALSNNEVGIDIEYVRKYNESLRNLVLSDDEKISLRNSRDEDEYFFRLWTLKESFIKAIGRGLSYSMKKINFSIVGDKILSNVDNFNFNQKIIELGDKKYIISVAWGDENELVL